MSDDNEARARELARKIYADLERFECLGPCQSDTGCLTLGICVSEVFVIETSVAAALDAAEDRGRIAGLEEAREIASGSFGWSMSVWRDMTKKDMTRLMAEAIVEAIDARLVTIAPPAGIALFHPATETGETK